MKKVWSVHIAGRPPFTMVLMEEAMDQEGATAYVQALWPGAVCR